MDLTVVAVPFYFGSMEAERRRLQREAAAGRPSAADYTPADTAASLAMGVGSMLLPLATSALMRHVLPGKGRHPKLLQYGLTKNIDSYNPIKIAFHEYGDIVRDVAASETWRERLSFVFRGPGWAYRQHALRRAAQPEMLTDAGVA